jgi:hypothetical protein
VVVEADDVAVSPVQAEPNLLHSQFGTELAAEQGCLSVDFDAVAVVVVVAAAAGVAAVVGTEQILAALFLLN